MKKDGLIIRDDVLGEGEVVQCNGVEASRMKIKAGNETVRVLKVKKRKILFRKHVYWELEHNNNNVL